MVRNGGTIRGRGPLACGAALLAVLLTGGSAVAEKLVLRNDCGTPVVVQVASVFHGVFRRDRPYLLQPGEATEPGITLSGAKLVTIFDAKVPNHVLYQSALSPDSHDRHFHILPDYPPRVRLQMHVSAH